MKLEQKSKEVTPFCGSATWFSISSLNYENIIEIIFNKRLLQKGLVSNSGIVEHNCPHPQMGKKSPKPTKDKTKAGDRHDKY
jgi:hypothetical protein